MSELDDFLTATLPRQIEAETAIHNGDVEPATGNVVKEGSRDAPRCVRHRAQRLG